MTQVIVVGGGLAGLSAAHTVLERGGRVLVLDKNPFLGGNSTKATSGINGALTKTQIKQGIPDSAEKFYEDTAKSARTLIRPPLVKVLTGNSASAVEWLQEKFELDLSLVSRLGGHSFPRTHRGKEKFPGMTITYALMEKFEEIVAKEPQKARLLKKARATKLIQDETGKVVGIEYEYDGKTFEEYGVVVLATGGYAADFAENGLLKQYRPDVFNLPTTNGDHSTGDGIKMVKLIGGNAIDMEKVQVHPTGLVDPNEPEAKVKFLAAEALRGCGGVLLDNQGKRFCDELGHRDYVTGEMWKNNKAPYRLVLNSAAAKEIEWHCKHYMGRGLMKRYATGADLAKEMGISLETVRDTFTKYNDYSKNNNDPFGKKYFHNLPLDVNDEFYVAIVTPVVHYTMGGLEIDDESRVLSSKGAIPGLFAAGELCGGVHGENRLGGSSLLGCVVYGRVSGASAAHYLLGTLADPTATKRLSALGSQLGAVSVSSGELKFGATVTQNNVSTKVEVDPSQRRLQLEVSWNGQGQTVTVTPQGSSVTSAPSVSAPSAAPAPASSAPTPAPASQDKNKEFSLEEVAKHNTEKDCWVIVNGQVLDVTDFLKDHPGGKKAILIYAGKDATVEFNMLHKADVVEKYAPASIIGVVKGGSSSGHEAPAPAAAPAPAPSATTSSQPTNRKLDLKPSNTESWNSGGTADILPAERAKVSFDIEKLTHILDGGPEATKRRRFILSPIEKMPTVGVEKYNMDMKQLTKEHVKHFIGVHEAFWETFRPTRDDVIWMTENAVFSGSLMNHYGLFLPTIEVHGTDQQRQWWFDKAKMMKIVGSYAQTELGHGSNVRGLRTVAEFDKSTQEFVLNTPTLQAMKWWPGTLGKIATHALVYAQLIIDGKEYGVHSFMVQIRDENHKPLPGIELGDLGPKMGDNSNDTGYMRMQNVRIPREFMLSRYQQVTSDGRYVKSGEKEKNAKLHYTTMIFTRGAMVKSSGGNLARACAIAVRYSIVRKQGYVDSKKGHTYKAPEKSILDHQVQRYRVLRQVALCYSIKFTGAWMLNRFKDLDSATGGGLSNLEALPEIAAMSGGLKSLCTFLAWQGIEDLRKCCGGNGYLMSSGVAPMSANYVWQTTAEGDWIILMLQTAGFLMKTLTQAMRGAALSEVVSYLSPLQDPNFNFAECKLPQASSSKDFHNLDFLLDMFNRCALLTVANVGQTFQTKLAENDGKFDEAFNSCALELTMAVRIHCFCFMLGKFVQAVKSVADTSVQAVLSRLCALYACSNMLDESVWTGHITSPQMQMVKAAVVELLNKLRPDAVGLVDAFDISDKILNSTIGRHDGNVYEALYEGATKSQLNQSDPFDGYQEYLRPCLDLETLKRGNKVPPSTPSKL